MTETLTTATAKVAEAKARAVAVRAERSPEANARADALVAAVPAILAHSFFDLGRPAVKGRRFIVTLMPEGEPDPRVML